MALLTTSQIVTYEMADAMYETTRIEEDSETLSPELLQRYSAVSEDPVTPVEADAIAATATAATAATATTATTAAGPAAVTAGAAASPNATPKQDKRKPQTKDFFHWLFSRSGEFEREFTILNCLGSLNIVVLFTAPIFPYFTIHTCLLACLHSQYIHTYIHTHTHTHTLCRPELL